MPALLWSSHPKLQWACAEAPDAICPTSCTTVLKPGRKPSSTLPANNCIFAVAMTEISFPVPVTKFCKSCWLSASATNTTASSPACRKAAWAALILFKSTCPVVGSSARCAHARAHACALAYACICGHVFYTYAYACALVLLFSHAIMLMMALMLVIKHMLMPEITLMCC